MAKGRKPNPEDERGEKKRATFFAFTETMRRIKYISFIEGTSITDSIEKALTDYIERWEKKNGSVPKSK